MESLVESLVESFKCNKMLLFCEHDAIHVHVPYFTVCVRNHTSNALLLCTQHQIDYAALNFLQCVPVAID